MPRLTVAFVVLFVLAAAVASWDVAHDAAAGACTAEAAARTVSLWRLAIVVQCGLAVAFIGGVASWKD